MKYNIVGNPNGKTVLFLHGWPDSPDLWVNQVNALQEDYRCVLFTIPGYEQTPSQSDASAFPFFGYSFPSICQQFRSAIVNDVMKDRPVHDQKPPMAIVHDWGCPILYETLYMYPNLCSRIVCCDIGAHRDAFPGVIPTLILLVYQLTLAFLFLLPRFLGTPLTKLSARLLGAPQPEKAFAQMNYLYFQVWKSIFTFQGVPMMHLNAWKPPTCPVLFLYAMKAPIRFFSKKWLDFCTDAEKGSEVIPVASDHWFMLRKKTKDDVSAAIKKFLDKEK